METIGPLITGKYAVTGVSGIWGKWVTKSRQQAPWEGEVNGRSGQRVGV
jgi:hypothetical protein